MDFQKVLQNFEGTEGIIFEKLLNEKNETVEILYELQTNQGILYLYEIDYVGDSMANLRKLIETAVGAPVEFFKVKNPANFTNATPVTSAKVYEKPEGWNEIASYANSENGSAKYFFNFLCKIHNR